MSRSDCGHKLDRVLPHIPPRCSYSLSICTPPYVCVSRFKCVAPPPSYVHNMSLLPIKPATVDTVSHTDPEQETHPRPSSAEPEPNPSAAAGKSPVI